MASRVATEANCHLIIVANEETEYEQLDVNKRVAVKVSPDFQGSFGTRYFAFFDWVGRCTKGGTKYMPYPPNVSFLDLSGFAEIRAAGKLQTFLLAYAQSQNVSDVKIPLDWEQLLNLTTYEEFEKWIS